MDRDENSAVNILKRYIARIGSHTERISVRCADVFTAIDDVNTLRKAGLGAMILLEQPSSATCVPNTQLCIAAIFAIGILACLILCVAAFALLVSLMTLALQAIGELATQLLLVYQQGDSVVRLMMWFCLAFVLVKLYPVIKRSRQASLKFSVTN